ncbi:MAG: amidohydrolase family protein [Desulfovibrionaceae bacterium]|nr:amidohydrolase family protein [Desulfovibrionaceae bacterium]
MRIDVHAHAFHPKIAHKVIVQLEGHYGIHPVGTGKADDLISRLDKAGLDKAVVLTAATSPDQVVPANNWAIGLKKSEPRFIPFGTVHPDYEHIEEELDRLEENGIKGLKFHPDFQGYRMDDESLYQVMEMIGDRFVCMFHVGDTLPPDRNPSCPKKMAALRKAFPGPVMIAAHMGGYRHWEYVRENLSGTDVYVDCSSVMDFLDDGQLTRLFKSYDREHILFGSDYPLYDADSEIRTVTRRLGLTQSQVDGLLSRAGELLS